MRTFEHFPADSVCKICNTSVDKPCCLAGIDGTEDDGIEEGEPVHVECIIDNLRCYLDFAGQRAIFYATAERIRREKGGGRP